MTPTSRRGWDGIPDGGESDFQPLNMGSFVGGIPAAAFFMTDFSNLLVKTSLSQELLLREGVY